MKKILLAILLLSIVGFSKKTNSNNAAATVNQLQGVYVFTDSKPVAEYEYLGTVKNTMSLTSGQYEPVRDKLLKTLKKKFPEANGAIMRFVNGPADHADAIKFKE